MNALGLVKNFVAAAAIAKYRIVSFGASEGQVVQSTSDAGVLGVTGPRGAAAAGDRIDIYLSEIRDVEFGAPVTFGDYVTADATGRAVKAAPGAGVKMEVLGRAMETGPVGTIGKIKIEPQQITG